MSNVSHPVLKAGICGKNPSLTMEEEEEEEEDEGKGGRMKRIERQSFALMLLLRKASGDRIKTCLLLKPPNHGRPVTTGSLSCRDESEDEG